LDYAADFSEIDLINRIAITYRWGSKKSKDFDTKVKITVDEEKENAKQAEKIFKKAKNLYYKKEYLRASDLLANIVTLYPNFESPKHFYENIRNMMKRTAQQENNLDFGQVIYASCYVNYYNAKYKEALSDWKKYLNFKGKNEEVREYSEKIDSEIKIEELKKRKFELNLKSVELHEEGIKEYNKRRWIACIKKMERLKEFVTENNFSKTVEYYDKAKKYINKSVYELFKNIKSTNNNKTPEKKL
jgi:tetratricopeptide (TPR) repeat protein